MISDPKAQRVNGIDFLNVGSLPRSIRMTKGTFFNPHQTRAAAGRSWEGRDLRMWKEKYSDVTSPETPTGMSGHQTDPCRTEA